MTIECKADVAEILAQQVLMRSGASEPNAYSVAKALIAAEVDGIPSHGLSRLPYYADQTVSGKVNGKAVPVIKERGVIVNVDALEGFAFPAIQMGIPRLLACARKQGLGALSVRNSHHFGVAGHHVEAIAREGLVGLGFGNAPAAIAPWGGKQALFGTNPIAFAAPRKETAPVVLDLSVSCVARGKVMMAANRSEAIPEGWALDSEGRPTTDAASAMDGSMRPIGDAKGSALALMVEILAAGLSDSAFGYEASSLFNAEGEPPRLGQLFLAINPAHFSAGDAFVARVEALLSTMLGQQGVRLPGERRLKERSKFDGNLLIDDTLYADLVQRAGGLEES